ncbi:MAG TPA: DUF296 domain-containing protein [Rhodoblastus sp.]|nr:DUF296 domain-containing protein [Rhodoblastus sp.]
MARPSHVAQPGPALAPRVVAVEGRGRAFRMPLAAGALLVDAVRDGFAREGFVSGALNIGDLALGPFAYVMPALSKDGKNAAFYSETFRPEGVTRFECGALTFGSRDSAPFFHCHGLWREANGRRRGGHVLPEETRLAEDATVEAFGIVGANFEAAADPETNFKLFGPVRAPARAAQTDRRAFALRLRPNQCFHAALEDFAREAGLAHARIYGGVGSTIGALFEDGQEIRNFATEMFIRKGDIARAAGDARTAHLDVGVVDCAGVMAEGLLQRGGNRILMTLELIVAED